jgi:hypothetical protein
MAVMQYFVVMIDYGRRGREAIVDPEITRREVIARVASGEYRNISFIHEIDDFAVEDVTANILAEAAIPEISTGGAELQASRFDHARDLRKHERVWRPPNDGGSAHPQTLPPNFDSIARRVLTVSSLASISTSLQRTTAP